VNGSCEHDIDPLGSIMLSIFSVAEQLSGLQKRLSSMG
jgi:hypothetical protein